MSWKDVNNGKTDIELYKAFHEHFSKDTTISSVLEDTYGGDDKPLILEQIGVNLSQVGMIFDEDDEDATELCAKRFHAMRARQVLDKVIRPLCKATDENLENTEVRPFCLYSIDAAEVYKQDLSYLPNNAVQFARLAIEHEMDCAYEDSEDGDEEDDDDDYSDEEDIDAEELKDIENEQLKDGDNITFPMGKGKSKDTVEEVDVEEEKEEEDEAAEFELPFEESECSIIDTVETLKQLKDHESKIREALEKETGISIDKFKSYAFPGRHYVVAWLEGVGMFGLRISELFEMDEDEDNEQAKSSKAITA